MHSYVLYGMDETGRVVEAAEIGASSIEQARRIALRRAKNYPKAELWDGLLCESRFCRRDRGAARGPLHAATPSQRLPLGQLKRVFLG